MNFVTEFSEKNPELHLVGGKGLNLIKLSNQKFNVPPGFVITTTGYKEFIQYNKLQESILAHVREVHTKNLDNVEQISQEIRSLIEKGSLSGQLKQEITRKLINIEQKSFSVRSSATAEDLPDFSFAGLHDTILNVKGLENIFQAVKKCFSSLWTTRAIEYRMKNGIDQQDIALAVVIQELIPSAISGVLFTADPLTNSRKKMIIEATYGLGEALVSGQVIPDHYETNYKGTIIGKKIGSKKVQIIAKENGGTEEIRQNTKNKETLTKKQVQELVELGKNVQDYYKSPQDIEWAYFKGILYLLQSRAITTLYKIDKEILQEKRLEAFMSFNMVQGIMEPITPLGMETIRLMIQSIGHFFGVEKPKAVYTTSERIWIKFTPALENRILYNVLTKGFLALAEPETQKIFLFLNKNKVFKIKGGPPSLRKSKKPVRFFLNFFGRMRKNIENPVARRELVFSDTEKFIGILKGKSKRLTDTEQRLRFNLWTSSNMFPYFIINQASLVGSGIGMPFFAIKKLASTVKGGDDLLASLASDIPYNVTSDMNRWTWELVKPLKQEPEIVKLFEEKANEEISRLFLEQRLPPKLQSAIQQFLDKYGFRGFNELDIGRDRWMDRPEYVIQNFATYMAIKDPNKYPDVIAKQNKEKAKKAYATLLYKLRTSEKGFMKAKIFKKLFVPFHELAGLREYPKYNMIRVLYLLRENYNKIGKELVEKDQLTAEKDIYYLKINEIEHALKSTKHYRTLVEERKKSFEKEMSRRELPHVILSDGTIYYEAPANLKDKNMIIGSGVSAGKVTGKVRVLLDPYSEQLEAGEILVCPGTDPSWTPLFQVAGGLITEVGGMMTHGSVVAREFGIPAVVGINRATTKLQNGQLIEINGTNGTIKIIEEK